MTTAQQTWLNDLQPLLTNSLDLERLRGRRIAGILGDAPSTYAKSPRLWNAAFQALELNATYVPFDVPQGKLRQVLQLLRASDAFLGGSVTVPYKKEAIPLLDEVDPLTARIGAVNVIVRTPEGRLIGYNTDGLGGMQALRAAHGRSDLSSARVLLIGAGGAGQALAFFLWNEMVKGELVIANRTRASAQALAQRLLAMRSGHVVSVGDEGITEHAPAMDVIINATVKGQAGVRTLVDGRWTCCEPYSALGPAAPAVMPASISASDPAFIEAWFRESMRDIQRNQERSLQVCARLARRALCYDIIYAPLETVFLRHARWSGHATLNGIEMNIGQAVEAFTRYVCRDWLSERGLASPEGFARVMQAMAGQWGQ